MARWCLHLPAKLWPIRRLLGAVVMSDPSTVLKILDLARWTPSGDNTQPWRFEIVDDFNLVVHGFDTRDHVVYDLDGRPSQISLGALLETIKIAATGHGRGMVVRRRMAMPETTPTFDIQLPVEPEVLRDELISCIPIRTVQRRAMSTRRLSSAEKTALETCVAPRFAIRWLEGLGPKWRAARLMFSNAKLRLIMPEAYPVHRDIIEWRAKFSVDRVPDQALGADAMTLRLMRYVMKDWDRVSFFNRYLAGTLAPRLQMDLWPGMACAAHYVLVDSHLPSTVDDHVAAGRAVQRLWLTLTKLGLHQQPEMTPLIFDAYVRQGRVFCKDAEVSALAVSLAGRFREVIGLDAAHAVWMGRVGAGRPAQSRSLRHELNDLMWLK